MAFSQLVFFKQKQLTVEGDGERGHEEGHPGPPVRPVAGVLAAAVLRRQQEVVAAEGDDVEGVLLAVDGLEEGLVREAGNLGVVQSDSAVRARGRRRRRRRNAGAAIKMQCLQICQLLQVCNPYGRLAVRFLQDAIFRLDLEFWFE